MNRVYAYRDLGSKLNVETRWAPRVVECTVASDDGSESKARYIVKYRRRHHECPAVGPASAAMSISEVVGYGLIMRMNIRTPVPAWVYVSEEFANSYGKQNEWSVIEGYHFGTLEMDNLLPTDGLELQDFANPLQWVSLWAVDNWIMTIDRNNYGNTMCLPHGNKYELVAVDQSDCFCGSSALANGGCFVHMNENCRSAYPCGWFDHLFLDHDGFKQLATSADDIIGLLPSLPDICKEVHGQWWDEAGVDPAEMIRCLDDRARRIRQICNWTHWEGIQNAICGGQQILGL